MKITQIKKARKDYPDQTINKGDQYFYCEPQRRKTGGVRKMRFKTLSACQSWIVSYSKRFQGEFSTNMEVYNEQFNNLENQDQKDELLNEIDQFIDEKQSNLDNIPYQLQESHILTEQLEQLNELRDEVDNWEE